MLRKYRFKNWRFVVRQYYYADSDCTRPEYAIVARGDYKTRDPSWVVSGGTDAVYDLAEVTYTPYTERAAAIGDVINRTCGATVAPPWRVFRTYDVLQFGELDARKRHLDVDCTRALHFSLHELQLVRLEVARRHLGLRHSLYLGAVHPTTGGRPHELRPYSYQTPLARANQVRSERFT